MTHYLRWNGHTVADVDCWKEDMSAVVVVGYYSMMLLAAPESQRSEMLVDFDRINELRGEWWERAKMLGVTTDSLARQVLKEIGKKYDLAYVTD